MKTFFTLMQIIAEATGVTPAELVSKKRSQELVDAREIFVRICRDELHYSYPRIGRELDRDHTSIMHLERRQKVDHYDYDAVLQAFVEKRGTSGS